MNISIPRRGVRACRRTVDHFVSIIRERLACFLQSLNPPKLRTVAAFETFERRQLLSTISLSNGLLTVSGDSTTTRISVELADSSTIRARTSNLSKSYARSSVSSIKINGGAKGELISITSQLSTPATIYGNGGNDTIWAGNGNESIYGGDGNDQLNARGGNDKLYGDAGNDILDGGNGTDLVSVGSGTNVTRLTEGSITSSTGTVPTPVSNNSAGAPVPVITAMQTSIAVNQAIHVNAIQGTTLNSGTPITARYVWDFGDPNGKYNKLEGFNAAHVYDTAGTYTIKLTITNEAGKSASTTRTVTVASNTRRKIYVSGAGSDSNSGSSTSPIRTATRAAQLMSKSSNVEVLFRRGDQFQLANSFVTHGNNVVIGAYGTGSRPQLNINGYKGLSFLAMWGRDTLVSGLTFNDPNQAAKGVSPHGVNVVVRDCQFLKIQDGINANGKPTGVLAQDNIAPVVDSVKGYMIWSEGKDHVFLGNNMANSIDQHCIRNGGTDRMLVAYNTLTNLDRRSVNPYDFDRQTLTLHTGNYTWVAHNTFTGGRVEIGPLGDGDGIKDPNYVNERQRWTVVEGNVFHCSIDIDHGSEHTVLRNNILDKKDWPAIKVDGYSNTYGRGVVDLNVFNNTIINTGTDSNGLKINGKVDGINVINNLYIGSNVATGANTAAPLYVADGSLRSFTKVTNNVWYVGKILGYAEGGINYIWYSWSDSEGYRTPTEWNALPQVGTDIFSKTTVDSRWAPTSGSSAIGAGTHAPGVFIDFYGNTRPGTGITVGAVQV